MLLLKLVLYFLLGISSTLHWLSMGTWAVSHALPATKHTNTLFLHSFAHDSKWTKWWVPHTLKHSSCCLWGHLCSPVVLWSREGPAWCCHSSWAPLESTGGCCWARCPISCAPVVVSKSLPAACSTLGIKQPTTRVQPAVVWAFQCENSSFCKCNCLNAHVSHTADREKGASRHS